MLVVAKPARVLTLPGTFTGSLLIWMLERVRGRRCERLWHTDVF